MILSYTADQIRAAETAALAATPQGALMSRAARAVADAVTARLPLPRPGRSVVLLVGAGNNGGDALYAGVTLRKRGAAITAVLAHPDRAHAEGMAALRRAGGRVIGVDSPRLTAALARADVIIDGLVGIGFTPPLRDAAALLVEAAAASSALKVAVDIPSGIDPDTGAGDGFRADITVTLGGMKTGLLLADAAGRVILAEIGMDPAVWAPEAGYDASAITDRSVNALVPQPGTADNKYSGGATAIVAGSPRYPGAALLAAGAAVRLRPGLVRAIGPQGAAVVQRWPEVVARPTVAEAGTVQAWVVGPGMGTDGAALAVLREVLDQPAPVLVDADGLTLLASSPELLSLRHSRGFATVLTPHAGEFTRLFPDLDPADRLRSARAAAARSGAIVLLKGHRTVTAAPDGRTFITLTGSPYLATAGSGDVLSGMAGTLLATGLDPLEAVARAAHLHGLAGERAQASGRIGASALIELLGSGSEPVARECDCIEG